MAHRSLRRHQSRGKFHLRLPAAGVVLSVIGSMIRRDYYLKITDLLRLGPRGREITAPDQPCESFVAQVALRHHCHAEVKRTLNLLIPESVPVGLDRCEPRIDVRAYCRGYLPPSVARCCETCFAQAVGVVTIRSPRHHCRKAMRQRWSHTCAQRWSWQAITEPCLPYKPQVDQRCATQGGVYECRWPETLQDRLHRLKGKPGQQRAAGPEITHATSRLNERLHWSEHE